MLSPADRLFLDVEVDTPFDRCFPATTTDGGSLWRFEPSVNVAETDENYEITAELPSNL